ncbi:MAG: tetratricopeptide repeat protein [Gemmatimonadetes bacterium]|nr:tetratricopeptide repeat protein [Gemmatimonadota bacterium]
MKPTLTIAMIVRNERENLEQLLPDVTGAVDDVVIVDTGSGDGTPEVAARLGARVFSRPWDDDFSAARNRGLEEVRTSHVLWLDADDRLDVEGLRRVVEAIRREPTKAWMLLLVNEAATPTGVTSCWQMRAFPAASSHRFEGRIHEQVMPSLQADGTPIDRLDVTIRHLGYLDDENVLEKSRRNLELIRREAAETTELGSNQLFHWMKAASRCGELGEACDVARRLAETPPTGTPGEVRQAAFVEWGRLEAQRGRLDEAISVLERAIQECPDDPVARFFLGDLHRRQGNYLGALDQLLVARVSPVRPGNLPIPALGLAHGIRTLLGETLERLNRPADAVAVYREILVDLPEDRIATRNLVRALAAAGDSEGAARMLEQLPADAVPGRERLRMEAVIAFDRGQDTEAFDLFRRLEREEPRGWSAPLHLGHLALRSGHVEEARAHYERALDRGDQPEIRVGLAAALLEAGEARECLSQCAIAADRSHGRALPAGTEALSGEALFRLGRIEEAREAFEMHLKRLGPDPRVLARLADCYREGGAPAAARSGYEAALRLAPGLSEAVRGLEALSAAP